MPDPHTDDNASDIDEQLRDLVPPQTAAFAESLDRQWSHDESLSRSMEKIFKEASIQINQSTSAAHSHDQPSPSAGQSQDEQSTLSADPFIADFERQYQELRDELNRTAPSFAKASTAPVVHFSRPASQSSMRDLWLPEPPFVPPPPAKVNFLEDFDGTATLTYPGEDGKILAIDNLDLTTIAKRSEVIAAAFETSDFSKPRLHLDLLSPLTAAPFTRYLHTGSYLETGPYDDVPTSLLLHSQLYFLGKVFSMGELQSEALICVIRQCEFACSSPSKPIELCTALRFCYDHVDDNRRLIDEVIEYCIERFSAHSLGKDQEFLDLAYDHRPFYTDLAKACRRRGFEDDAALDIIRLPYNPKTPAYFASREEATNPRYQDVVYHFHHSDSFEEKSSTGHRKRKSEDIDETSKKVSKLPLRPTNPPSTSHLTLALRGPKPAADAEVSPVESVKNGFSSDSSWSEDEGFQIVKPLDQLSIRPKAKAPDSPDLSDYLELVVSPFDDEVGTTEASSSSNGSGEKSKPSMSGIDTHKGSSKQIDSDSEWELT